MNNFQEIANSTSATSAGFQFEFRCQQCGQTWRSPFTPYRAGQVSGLLSLLSRFMGVNMMARNATSSLATMRSSSARQKALAAAQAQAAQRFHTCDTCHKSVDNDCWDSAQGRCTACAQASAGSGSASGSASQAGGASAAGGHTCPNCQSPTDGGRFCPECGYDMATTHKSCPGCGALHQRQARFCTDCGHAF